jgi:hypothetical protein
MNNRDDFNSAAYMAQLNSNNNRSLQQQAEAYPAGLYQASAREAPSVGNASEAVEALKRRAERLRGELAEVDRIKSELATIERMLVAAESK